MRIRDAGMFAMGFAAALISLTLGYWVSGALRTPAPASGPKAAQLLPAPQIPAPSITDFSHPLPSSLSTAAVPAASLTSGEADRLAPEILPKLGMPIAGIPPDRLTNTYHDKRDGREHEALDIAAPRGTPVLAVAEGNVARLFTSKQGGLTVYQFDNSATWCYYYAHLDHYAASLKQGMLLRKGDILGYVGTTGDAPPNAPHLHFAVFRLGPEKQWWKGSPIDPLPLFR